MMNDGRWQAIIRHTDCGDAVDLTLYRIEGDQARVLTGPDEQGLWTSVPAGPDGSIDKPTMKFPGMLVRRGILKALADAIAGYGVKSDDDAKREGEIKATKYHLEDMRTLLKVNRGSS